MKRFDSDLILVWLGSLPVERFFVDEKLGFFGVLRGRLLDLLESRQLATLNASEKGKLNL